MSVRTFFKRRDYEIRRLNYGRIEESIYRANIRKDDVDTTEWKTWPNFAVLKLVSDKMLEKTGPLSIRMQKPKLWAEEWATGNDRTRKVSVSRFCFEGTVNVAFYACICDLLTVNEFQKHTTPRVIQFLKVKVVTDYWGYPFLSKLDFESVTRSFF